MENISTNINFTVKFLVAVQKNVKELVYNWSMSVHASQAFSTSSVPTV